MQIGMIGLGRMGANMVRRLVQGGHECVAYDPKPEAVRAVTGYGGRGVASPAELVRALKPPRAVWIMVPAALVDKVIEQLRPALEAGDVLVDGGNSNYHDDIRRADALRGAGIHYLDVGTSGGVLGFEQGYCLMIGGDDDRGRDARAGVRNACPGRAAAIGSRGGPRRQQRGRRARLPALRPFRRRTLREDGPQWHRVRADGRLRGRPQRPAPRQCRQEDRHGRCRDGAALRAALLPVRPERRGDHRGVAARQHHFLAPAGPHRRGARPGRPADRLSPARWPIRGRAAGRCRRPSRWACRRTC